MTALFYPALRGCLLAAANAPRDDASRFSARGRGFVIRPEVFDDVAQRRAKAYAGAGPLRSWPFVFGCTLPPCWRCGYCCGWAETAGGLRR